MKITVIADKSGKVIGTARTGISEDGKVKFGLVPLAGHVHHEVDIPDDVSKIKSAAEFHKSLAKMVKKGTSTTSLQPTLHVGQSSELV